MIRMVLMPNSQLTINNAQFVCFFTKGVPYYNGYCIEHYHTLKWPDPETDTDPENGTHS